MPKSSWFDDKTSEMLFFQYANQMASWQEAIADGVIDETDLARQGERVTQMLRALEPKLDDAVHEELTEVFFELAVFYGMVQTVQPSEVAQEED